MSESASFRLPDAAPSNGSAQSRNRGTSLDVVLFHTEDGGEIEIVNGVLTMSDGLETATYLSLFGGNERDSGLAADDRLQWWGNLGEPNEARAYRSQTQNLLRNLPATSANLRRVEDAVSRDLAWMTKTHVREVGVNVSIPKLNAIRIEVTLVMKDGTRRAPLGLTAPWRTAA